MPYTAPTVNYATTQNGTYTTLTGVQSVQIVRGRNYIQDNFQASTCVIELIPATSYATPLAIGQFIDVRVTNSATARAYFCGRITDIERTYDIPYTSATGAAPGDRIIISASGATGITAQYQFSASAGTLAADVTTTQMSQVFSPCGVILIPNIGSSINGSAISLPGQGAFDVINKLCRTGQHYVDEGDNERNTSTIFGSNLFAISTSAGLINASFSDTGAIRYNQLTFQSSAETRFNQINVYPDGLATQSTSGTAPFNSLDYYTNSATTSDAASLSGLLYNLFNTLTTPTPFTISTNTNVDDTWLAVAQLQTGTSGPAYLGGGATVTFRGTTVTAIIQKIAVVFTPDQATMTLNLAPSLGQAFILDSSQFGILDTNRLGYP
jgi:hypothetical protein